MDNEDKKDEEGPRLPSKGIIKGGLGEKPTTEQPEGPFEISNIGPKPPTPQPSGPPIGSDLETEDE